MTILLGIDIGGSGSRISIHAESGERRTLTGERMRISATGSSITEVACGLMAEAASEWPEEFARVGGIGVGSTGLGSLVARPDEVTGAILAAFSSLSEEHSSLRNPPPAVAIAIDAVTAHLGALAGEPGAVCALGTGAIALGSNGHDMWRRIDGWGHLLGDRGSGAWMGARALSVAILAHDGIDGSGAHILRLATERYGAPSTWPAQLYMRDDRAGVLAEFVPDLIALAESGDSEACAILSDAGKAAALSTIAALDTDLPHVVAGTGALLRAPTLLRESFEQTLLTRVPDVRIQETRGDPIDGAVVLAGRSAARQLSECNGFVWLLDARE